MTDIAELCAELSGLYRALGAAITPDRPEAPDRSSVSVLVAPALVATAPRWSQTRRAYGPSAPLNVGVLGAADEIAAAATGLAGDLRYRLGFAERPQDGLRALGALPALLDALPEAQRRSRWVDVGIRRLEAARRSARYALELDRRPVQLDPCPNTREDYAATWTEDWVPLTFWTDGVCRTYDAAASGAATRAARAEDPDAAIVDVWKISTLYCLDPSAGSNSLEAAIRCAGCGRVWRTDEEIRLLGRLLHSDGRPDPADAVRRVLYGRLAGLLRAWESVLIAEVG